uniref:Uncharacterized protein n=1 Tax=Romanomermis culicivorax TaxID=13658 RepID=A0A915JZB0_ROMCU
MFHLLLSLLLIILQFPAEKQLKAEFTKINLAFVNCTSTPVPAGWSFRGFTSRREPKNVERSYIVVAAEMGIISIFMKNVSLFVIRRDNFFNL